MEKESNLADKNGLLTFKNISKTREDILASVFEILGKSFQKTSKEVVQRKAKHGARSGTRTRTLK